MCDNPAGREPPSTPVDLSGHESLEEPSTALNRDLWRNGYTSERLTPGLKPR